MRTFKLALRKAEKHLAAVDPRLAKVIEAHGRCELTPYWDRSPYESLVRAVAYQQLHATAAQAILGRLVGKFPGQAFPAPADIVALTPEELRPLGFSLAKATTIRGIAAGAINGVVPSRETAETMTDEELIERLSSLRGIGRWTVEMLLIFTLGRLDVMPVDDFGVRAGLASVYRIRDKVTKHHFPRRTDRWAPYRSIGAWYLWREADRQKAAAKKSAKKRASAAV
jgi:DNA-3-methyladenine glycosylase II